MAGGSWFLFALVAVAIGYAIALFLPNRQGSDFDRAYSRLMLSVFGRVNPFQIQKPIAIFNSLDGLNEAGEMTKYHLSQARRISISASGCRSSELFGPLRIETDYQDIVLQPWEDAHGAFIELIKNFNSFDHRAFQRAQEEPQVKEFLLWEVRR